MQYLRLCLWTAAGVRSNPDEAKHKEKLNAYIRQNYQPNEENALQKYLEFIKHILRAKRGLIELSCLYDLLNADMQILTEQCFDLIVPLNAALKDVSEATRMVVAKNVGILWAANDISVFNEQIQTSLSSIANYSLEHRHGTLLAISHAFYRKIKQDGHANAGENFKVVVLLLCNYLANQQSLLVSAACKGLALIGSVTNLPLPDGHDEKTKPTANTDDNQMHVDDGDNDNDMTKYKIMEKLTQLLKSAHSRPRVREESAECLGHLSIGDGRFFTSKNLSTFLQLIKLVSLIIAKIQNSNEYLLIC